ncbi:amiloride-sensitive sodium channel subunit delta [Ornithorhynchus anatinus]|uniref:amiloride-sensitive sodium channel subunit delta n=1 Tax=Ornithorhynchus anatinus TaxID=9258 RepID=UPI0010A833AD|nr:amiloride-sensitive sodium channel subunit delta [Ornithorhynchus anatinus]
MEPGLGDTPRQRTEEEEENDEGLIELFDSFRDLFHFFCNNTTIHGMVRLVCSSHNRLKTAFWSLLFLATVGMLYWQFGLLFDQYWRYPVIMTMSVHSEPKMFPAITLCDMNPHRPPLVGQHLADLDQFMQENIWELYQFNLSKAPARPPREIQVPLASGLRNFSLNRDIRLEKLRSRVGSHGDSRVGFKLCNSSSSDCFYREHSSAVDAIQDWYRFHLVNIMALLPPGATEEESHSVHSKNFIYSCHYNGEPCQETNYETFHHPMYGSCYTFNSHGTDSFWKANRSGVPYGISLILKAEQNKHLPLLSTEAGIKVMIHGKNQTPFLEHEGFSIRPGIETTIGIREDEVHRLGGNYGRCTEDGTDVDVQLLYNSSYTMQACLHSCFQQLLIEKCHCGCYFYPLPRGAEYCDYNQHPGWGHCFYSLYKNLETHRLSCFSRCPKPCWQSLHKLSAGTAKWPSTESEDWILAAIGQKKKQSLSQRSKVAKVNIFYQQLNYRLVGERPVYSVNELLSTMGTHWSLWFGSSVLSVVEMLELLLDSAILALFLAYRRLCGRKKLRVRSALEAGPRTPEDPEGPGTVRAVAIKTSGAWGLWGSHPTTGRRWSTCPNPWLND